MSKIAAAALIGVLAFASAPAMADAVSDFYRGKQIRVIVRTTPATDYDQYSRLIARFMGKYIPGNPSMIVVNMPGGGGITAANYFTQVAPHDGTVIGIVSQGLAADQALGMSPQFKADLREFNWIANVIFSNQLLAVWHTSPTKTIEEAKQRVTTIGTTGAGSASVQYRRSTTMCSAPNSRSCSAIPAARISTWRWSAARSKGAAPIRIRPTWGRIRIGYRGGCSFRWSSPASKRNRSCRTCR
jgi:tripartite-type tricarboxylate transporter receptor subunit TctC